MSGRRIVSPSQVIRFDGNKVFVELMSNGIQNNKIFLNFCEYDKSASKGSRMKNSVSIYLDIHGASVLAEDILSGRMQKLAEEKRAAAAKKNSKYPDPVWVSMGGTNPADAGRKDNKAESRQFKLIPGSAKPWIITAEKGPGHLSETGLIVPEYTVANGAEAVIRVPMMDEDLKRMALILRNLYSLWLLEKFGEINGFDVASLTGYNKMGEKTAKASSFVQGSESPELDLTPGLQLDFLVSCLPIDRMLFEFRPDPKAERANDKEKLGVYMEVSKAQVLAYDILSGRLAKIGAIQAKKNSFEPLYHELGGTHKDEKITSRQLKILRTSDPNLWVFQAVCGPGHLSSTGLIVPDYSDEKAEKRYRLCLTSEELKRFAILIQNTAMLWMFKKFGPLVHDGFVRKRKETEEKIAELRK